LGSFPMLHAVNLTIHWKLVSPPRVLELRMLLCWNPNFNWYYCNRCNH